MPARQQSKPKKVSATFQEKIHSIFEVASFSKTWRSILVAGILVTLFALAVRLNDYSKWDHPALKLMGDHILGTHDAYFWMAGAEKIGSAADQALSIFADVVSRVSGVSLTTVGFWAPAVFCALTSTVVFLWGRFLAGLGAGLFAGVVGGLASGYYLRTRLAYYDTDMVTLTFPLLISFALAYWAAPKIRKVWLQETNAQMRDDLAGIGWPYAIGLLAHFAAWWHTAIGAFNILMFWIALLLFLVLSPPGRRARNLFELAVFALAALWGWFGIVAGLALLLIRRLAARRFQLVENNIWTVLAILAVIAVGAGLVDELHHHVYNRIAVYLKPVAETAKEGETVVFPSITQSVVEAQNVPWKQVLTRMTPYAWLSVLGYLGFLFALIIRPGLVFLAPLAALSLMSYKMGARFTMFGGPVVALGLAAPLEWLLRWLFYNKPWRRYATWGVMAGLGLLIMAQTLFFYFQIGPTPVLAKYHAGSLSALRDITTPRSQVWTWWDWGYPTDFYSQRKSFADGGKHSGDRIYPLGLALISDSPQQSAQMVHFTAAVNNSLPSAFKGRSPKEVQRFIQSLREKEIEIPKTPKQYLVTTWENFRLIHWISFYGSWNFITKSGFHAKSYQVNQQFQVNEQEGVLRSPNQNPINLKSIDVCSSKGSQHQEYSHPSGPHMVYNRDVNQVFLMDDMAYNSMMVQLLIGDYNNPKLKKHFHLVWEGYPNIRIYEVRP
jgi:dolichyl-diphosphooligosaccharide--protein glycosyltransferase